MNQWEFLLDTKLLMFVEACVVDFKGGLHLKI